VAEFVDHREHGEARGDPRTEGERVQQADEHEEQGEAGAHGRGETEKRETATGAA